MQVGEIVASTSRAQIRSGSLQFNETLINPLNRPGFSGDIRVMRPRPLPPADDSMPVRITLVHEEVKRLSPD